MTDCLELASDHVFPSVRSSVIVTGKQRRCASRQKPRPPQYQSFFSLGTDPVEAVQLQASANRAATSQA